MPDCEHGELDVAFPTPPPFTDLPVKFYFMLICRLGIECAPLISSIVGNRLLSLVSFTSEPVSFLTVPKPLSNCVE